jgi:UDP-glucose 4-epimerase
MIERMLADYRSAYGFGSFALRYFNASGADASGGIGEMRDNETHHPPRDDGVAGPFVRLRRVRR